MRRLFALALAFASALPLAACSDAGEGAGEEESREASEDALTGKGRVQIVVSVDWEGRDLTQENIGAMRQLRVDYPSVRIVQFLNAAYFTKPGADAAAVRAQVKSALLPTDELGLHIHGWKRLFEAAGVTFRSTPTFWGRNYLSNDCGFDCGHEVPISAYTESELEKVIAYSIATLEANGFGHARSFRCGGWMAKDNVRQALVAQGIRWDSSAVPTTFLSTELATLPVLDWLSEEWRGTTARVAALRHPHGGGRPRGDARQRRARRLRHRGRDVHRVPAGQGAMAGATSRRARWSASASTRRPPRATCRAYARPSTASSPTRSRRRAHLEGHDALPARLLIASARAQPVLRSSIGFVLPRAAGRLSPGAVEARRRAPASPKESGFGQGTFTVKVQGKLAWSGCADGNARDVTCSVDDAKYRCTCHVGTSTYQSFDWDQKLAGEGAGGLAMANGGCGWGTVQSSR